VDALGSGLIVVGSLQFGGVVVLGKIVTDGGLPVPAYLAIRFAAAAVLLAVALAATRQSLAAARREGWRLLLLGMAGYGGRGRAVLRRAAPRQRRNGNAAVLHLCLQRVRRVRQMKMQV
jgi:hypothetical protein